MPSQEQQAAPAGENNVPEEQPPEQGDPSTTIKPHTEPPLNPNSLHRRSRHTPVSPADLQALHSLVEASLPNGVNHADKVSSPKQ
jgi:hypothetical protein